MWLREQFELSLYCILGNLWFSFKSLWLLFLSQLKGSKSTILQMHKACNHLWNSVSVRIAVKLWRSFFPLLKDDKKAQGTLSSQSKLSVRSEVLGVSQSPPTCSNGIWLNPNTEHKKYVRWSHSAFSNNRICNADLLISKAVSDCNSMLVL